jgi:BirA family biotin operon repressor/biotin-[acetyl-CoA-carboxylase] ligase
MIFMIIGSKIIFISDLTSTNTYAIRLISMERPQEGTIIRTEFQSAGRGQPGNKWVSERGKNLLFSIILFPQMIKPVEQFTVSMAISLGIHDFLTRKVTGCSIKWPNDVYVSNDKIAGILIESSLMGDNIEYLVAGIGLNINQERFTRDALNPVALKMITGKDYELKDCLIELAGDLDKRYGQLTAGGSENIKDEYISKLYRLNEWNGFRDSGGRFTGRILSVSNSGRLLLEKKSGQKMQYYFKDVEFFP